MGVEKRDEHWYGGEQADIRSELLRYSEQNGYLAQHLADAVCTCGAHVFRLNLDDAEGVAVRVCTACGADHPIGDSDEFLEDAELEKCECPCGGESFEITVGVSLYTDSEDVRWIYLGCRCPTCGLVACYGDWKNEYPDYHELLGRI